MKIGISSPYLDTLAGGERYVLTMAACLAKSHSIVVFWNDESIISKAEKRLSLSLDGVSVEPIPSNSFSRIRNSAMYDLLIYLSDGSLPFSLSKKNIIHFQIPFRNVNGMDFLNRLKMKRVNKIICNSNFTKEFIDQEFGVISDVIYPPVDLDKFKSGTKKNIILSVGRFHNLKKQDVLISVFNKLKLNDWKLVLAGGLLDQDQKYFDELNKSVIDQSVIFKPNILFSQLQKLYSEAKIYWHGAGYGEKSPENMEHFGITTVEAMAAGCVPVAYRGGGQKEIINNKVGGYLWDTTDELVKYTQELAGSTGLWERFSKQSKQDAVKYSETEFCKNWKELVEKL